MDKTEPLRHARAELQSARIALERMRDAKDFALFEGEWRSFLNSLEKSWKKAERACQIIQGDFQKFQAKYHAMRKKDMLLRYLKQARDADNHSIQEVVENLPGIYTFQLPGGPGIGYVERLVIGGDGRVAEYRGNRIPTITESPPQINVVKIQNSGVWFNPPTSHLGTKLSTLDPVELGEIGLRFYCDFLAEIEKEFFLK